MRMVAETSVLLNGLAIVITSPIKGLGMRPKMLGPKLKGNGAQQYFIHLTKETHSFDYVLHAPTDITFIP